MFTSVLVDGILVSASLSMENGHPKYKGVVQELMQFNL